MSHASAGKPRIYCAGPLFNQAERDEMTSIADVLNAAGYPVYLPHRDGMEFRHVLQILIDRGWQPAEAGHFLHAAIFALDIYQLVVECGAVVWNLNGRVPDEGAVSEAAIGWTLGKPLVAFKEDVRSMITGRDNPLLVGLVEFDTVSRIHEIVPALATSLANQAATHVDAQRLPARVRTAVEQGRELWDAMQSSDAQGNNAAIADAVSQLFADSIPRPGSPATPLAAH